MQFDIVANDKATPAMGKVEKSMETFGKRLSGSLAGAAVKAGLIMGAINRVIQTAGELGDVADEAAKLGVTVETYQRLKFAAEQYGLSVEDVAKGLVKVNNVLDEAATKGGPNAEILKALGFAQDEITNRVIKSEEVYKRLALAIGEARSEEEKFALASRVFGDRQAQAMVGVLSDYDAFLKTQKNVSVMSSENAKALDDFSEKGSAALNDLKTMLGDVAGAMARKMGFGETTPVPVNPADAEARKTQGQKMRDALLAATATEKKVEKTSGMAVTSLQEIGGGIARGPSALENYAERTAIATETLAGVATVDTGPVTGGTDITKTVIPGGSKTVMQSNDLVGKGLNLAPRTARPAR